MTKYSKTAHFLVLLLVILLTGCSVISDTVNYLKKSSSSVSQDNSNKLDILKGYWWGTDINSLIGFHFDGKGALNVALEQGIFEGKYSIDNNNQLIMTVPYKDGALKGTFLINGNHLEIKNLNINESESLQLHSVQQANYYTSAEAMVEQHVLRSGSIDQRQADIALLGAARERNLRVADMLIKNGANPHVKDFDGKTAADLINNK